MGLIKLIKQNSSKKVNNNKDFQVLVVRDSKLITTTINTKSAIEKLLSISTKVVLLEDE